jgi:transcriptional regulator with XRE-family HTH domain
MTIGTGRADAQRRLVVRQRLRERRRQLGLTQKQVVTRLAKLGVLTTNKALSSLEHGTGIDVAKLPEFARALECTVTYLLGLTADPCSWEPDQHPGTVRVQRPRATTIV